MRIKVARLSGLESNCDQSQGERNAHALARFAVRRSNAVEETRLHSNCLLHARAGHWREHGDLHRSQCSAVTFATLPRIRKVDGGGTRLSRQRLWFERQRTEVRLPARP